MQFIIYTLSLAIAVSARPDVAFLQNNGYQYQTNQIQNQNQNQFMQNEFMQQNLPSMTRNTNFDANLNFANQVVHQETDIEPQLIMEPPRQLYQTADSYQAAYQHSNMPHESGYAASAPQAQVHKHVYVHVPPKGFEEEDAVQPHVYHQSGTKQKHYKIVFIKTPTAPAMRPAIVAPPTQNEEKTLIYVLHKKPETQQDIVIPTAAPTTPSKPEVFFIKYKTKKEGAPVYGPPPVPTGTYPRHGNDPTADIASATAASAGEEQATELTTTMPTIADGQVSQHVSQQSEFYLPPTMPTNEQAANTMPSTLYLSPNENNQSPIVVDESQKPMALYGPPNKFFFKH